MYVLECYLALCICYVYVMHVLKKYSRVNYASAPQCNVLHDKTNDPTTHAYRLLTAVRCGLPVRVVGVAEDRTNI